MLAGSLRIVVPVLAAILLASPARYAPAIRLDRSTPAWERVVREIRAQGLGNCYLAAFTLATHAGELGLEHVVVVEGTQMGEGAIAGTRFGHSWVEADVDGGERVAIDYSSGNALVMDRDTYRFIRQARDVHEYGVSEAERLAAGGDYGPWTEDVLNAWHP